MNNRPNFAELSAYLYLSIPVVIFQLTFLKPWIGIPGALLIAGNFAAICRKAAKDNLAPPWWALGFSLVIVAMWMLVGGYGLVFPVNSDWIKHYAIVNELADNRWPVIENGQTLRYGLGWYVVPSLALKVFGGHANLYLSAWTLIGMAIFMRLALSLFPSNAYWIAMPVVFMAFSGADILGTWWTHYQFGPIYHLEWWAGWGEYPSSTTSIFWTPQHALPAWIGIALLMRQRDFPSMIPSLGILFFAVCFWSPFAAIGLAPFVLLVFPRHGLSSILSWRSLAALVLIGVPLALYLTSDTTAIPAYFAAFGKCTKAADLCFSLRTYSVFVVAEFLLFAVVLFAAKVGQQDALVISSILLLLFPLVHFGIANDLMMRSSIASLAVLAILSAHVISSRATWAAMSLIVLLLVGLPTSGGEIARGILKDHWFPEKSTIADATAPSPGLRAQYFARSVSITRSPEATTVAESKHLDTRPLMKHSHEVSVESGKSRISF